MKRRAAAAAAALAAASVFVSADVGAAPPTCPTFISVVVGGSYEPPAALVEEHRLKARLWGADRFRICYDDLGLFVGFGMMKAAKGKTLPTFHLSIAANTNNYDVRAQAVSAGCDPTITCRVWVTVETGIYVGGGTGSPAYAMSWNTFVFGSDLRLINNGYVFGKGGNAGNGGHGANGGGGAAGVRALFLSDVPCGLTIDNTNGYIFGGGGGGGGGGSIGTSASGGGGGGGAGSPGGLKGTTAGVGGATNGTDGSTAGRGNGGAGGFFFGSYAGGGGNGGAAGAAGGNGGAGSPYSGGSGAGAGNAITTNGNPYEFIGGNNPSQVKGAIT